MPRAGCLGLLIEEPGMNISLRTMVAVAVFLLPKESPAVDPVLRDVIVSGDPAKRINVVFIAGGYTEEEKGSFEYLASRIPERGFERISPFREYRRFFNFYSVWAPSNERGISTGDTTVDNYWGSKRSGICTSIERIDDLNEYLDANIPEWDLGILVYRDTDRRGHHTCARRITVTPDKIKKPGDNKEWEQLNVIFHEFGHLISSLSDKHTLLSGCKTLASTPYEEHVSEPNLGKVAVGYYPTVPRAEAPQIINRAFNVSSIDDLPWKLWIDPSTPVPTPLTEEYENTVGAFKDCAGKYLPTQKCKMNGVYDDFCPICREALILGFYQFCHPVDSVLPAAGSTVTLDGSGSKMLSMIPMREHASSLRFVWTLNGTPISIENDTLVDLSALSLNVGDHTLACEVKDTSNWIRTYPEHELLSWSGSWQLKVTEEATSVLHRSRLTENTIKGMEPGDFRFFQPDGREIRNPEKFLTKKRGRQVLIIKFERGCRKTVF